MHTMHTIQYYAASQLFLLHLCSPTKRTPDVFIVEITSQSGENTGIHRKRGKRRRWAREKRRSSSISKGRRGGEEIFLYFWVTCKLIPFWEPYQTLTDAFTFDFEAWLMFFNLNLKLLRFILNPHTLFWNTLQNICIGPLASLFEWAILKKSHLKNISMICLYFPLGWAHLFQTLIEVSVVFGLRPSFY